jgi:hypothetical protein
MAISDLTRARITRTTPLTPPALNPRVGIETSTFEPVSPKLGPDNTVVPPNIKRVPMGSNIYVKSLLNSGWRWDAPSNVIPWNMAPNVPLSKPSGGDPAILGLPPVGTPPEYVAAAQAATQDAFTAWAQVANIHPQFTATAPDITMHVVPYNVLKTSLGGVSGTPIEAIKKTPAILELPTAGGGSVNLRTAGGGSVDTYISSAAYGAEPPSAADPNPLREEVWSLDKPTGKVSVTDRGKEMFIHEVGHALGLKHPFDTGAGGNNPATFPGIDPSSPTARTQQGHYKLGSKLGTIMSYTYANPPVDLPFGGAPGGSILTPMAFDIAAIQTLYGANTTTASGNNTYPLSDPGSADGMAWECIWDTGGIDQIVYNGAANAVIDLRPATLDESPTGAGMGSYTWNHTAVSRGGTIAGDITNALPDQGGVSGVVIENAHGGAGNDLITGNDADNVLTGGAGNDVITALAGNDIINGNDGDDTLTGGLGSDVFIFEPNSGHDRITDFDATSATHDFLDIGELGVTELNFASDVQMAQVGADTQLHIQPAGFGVSQIDLLGVNAATLNIGDFRFV